jgi:hypothetical protein
LCPSAHLMLQLWAAESATQVFNYCTALFYSSYGETEENYVNPQDGKHNSHRECSSGRYI